MILRKPYAFFIKYFRLIHFIMAILMGVLVIQTNAFLNFFNQYINQNMIVVGRDLVSDLFINFTYFYIIMVIILDVVVWVLLEIKQKKRLFYIINFFGYVLILIFNIYIRSVLVSMGEQIVDIRLIMVLRDITIICFTFQTLSIFITIIRAIGLNIKQFDFESDLKELNISEKDNEEFELNLELDSDKIKRDIRSNIRNFKYYFLENAKLIVPILSIVIIVIGVFIYQQTNGRVTKYNQGSYFRVPNYSLKVSETFIIDTDYGMQVIKENKSLVVLKISVKTTNKTSQFSFGKFALQIGNNKYYHTVEYAEKVKDLGKVYVKQKLTDEYVDYLLVYEIPISLQKEKMNLLYINEISSGILSSDKITKVSINPKSFAENQKENNLILNEMVSFDNSILGNGNFVVKEVLYAEHFKVNYRYCVTSSECYNVYEPLQASFYGSYDKALIKLNMDLVTESNIVKEVSGFITTFCNINYKLNGKSKTFRLQKQIVPKKVSSSSYFFEIPKEVLEAENIELVFNIRNQIYKYKIK